MTSIWPAQNHCLPTMVRAESCTRNLTTEISGCTSFSDKALPSVLQGISWCHWKQEWSAMEEWSSCPFWASILSRCADASSCFVLQVPGVGSKAAASRGEQLSTSSEPWGAKRAIFLSLGRRRSNDSEVRCSTDKLLLTRLWLPQLYTQCLLPLRMCGNKGMCDN